jgi:SpoVK/Ycf46/Vps4 family AAA+-type ATPase
MLEALNRAPRKQESLRSLLAGQDRKVWGAYIETVSELYDVEPKAVMEAFEAKLIELIHSDAEKKGLNPTLVMLGELLGLNITESKLLAFAEAREVFRPLREFLRRLKGGLDLYYTLVAAAIGEPKKEVQQSLRASGALRSFGLVKVQAKASDLEDFLILDSVGERLLSESFGSCEELLGHFIEAAPAPTLSDEDFPHLAEELGLLSAYLTKSKHEQIKGANILVYGPPGTGKSEFARLLAARCGLTAYEVKSTDEDGEPVPGRQRLMHFAWLQRFLSEREGAFLIFDEVEDAFPEPGEAKLLFGGKRRPGRLAGQSKAWMNQQLESSAVPSIWISNSIDGIDEAYLRRFAFHLEFRIPPAAVRQRIARKNLEGLSMSEAFIAGLALDDTLSPGQIGQAAEFARLCCGLTGQGHEQVMSRALNASQRAMGRLSKSHCSGGRHDECNFEYLNLDTRTPPEKLITSLARTGSGSVCFYGQPGTGKTSFARHISTALGKPLVLKRASDLLDMYVGQTEKLIAEMFRQAESEGAVLFLDEADSFLRDRKGARASWQVSQVNELLQQMEAFNGIFICATNLMDEVDAAALRRFTFKIRFDALDQRQRLRMFADMVLGTIDAPVRHEHAMRLDQMITLTPGDFATVRRQEQLLGENYEAEAFLCLLEQECQVKDGQVSRSIGFVT